MAPKLGVRGTLRLLRSASPRQYPLLPPQQPPPWRRLRAVIPRNKMSSQRLYSSQPPRDSDEEETAIEGEEEDTSFDMDDDLLSQLYGGSPTKNPPETTAESTDDWNPTEEWLSEEQQDAFFKDGVIPSVSAGEQVAESLTATVAGLELPEHEPPRHKFPLPMLPLPQGSHLKHRYHPVLHQFTNILMRHGKLSQAQTHIANTLNFLRMSPPPKLSPKYPLLPNTPPAAQLPLNPILYMTVAVDSVAPLVRIRRISGLVGGGSLLEIPEPLALRTRRRTAFSWILDAVEKKPSKGSGRKQFATRLGEEIVAVMEGRSGVWEKRESLHKIGTSARANLLLPSYQSLKKKGK